MSTNPDSNKTQLVEIAKTVGAILGVPLALFAVTNSIIAQPIVSLVVAIIAAVLISVWVVLSGWANITQIITTWLALAVVVLAGLVIWPRTMTVEGRISDSAGSPVGNERVILFDLSNRVYETKTDVDGFYQFTQVPTGKYRLQVRGSEVEGQTKGILVRVVQQNLAIPGVLAGAPSTPTTTLPTEAPTPTQTSPMETPAPKPPPDTLVSPTDAQVPPTYIFTAQPTGTSVTESTETLSPLRVTDTPGPKLSDIPTLTATYTHTQIVEARRARVGLYGRNEEFFEEVDYYVIWEARIESLMMMSNTSPEVFRRIKDENPDIEFIVRLYDDRMGVGHHPTPEQFADRMLPIMQLLRPYATKFMIHNRPNHLHRFEGWGQEDADARDFTEWFLEVYEILHRDADWAELGFPGLAVPHRDLEWIEIARPAVEKADWLGVQCFWQTTPDQPTNHLTDFWGLRFKYYHEKFPDKPIVITEFGNSNAQSGLSVDNEDVARQYVEYYQELFHYPYVHSAHAFILSSPDQIWDSFTWRTVGGEVKPVVYAIRDMPRPLLESLSTPYVTVTPEPKPPPNAFLHDTWTRPTDGMVMVYVPGGTFQMGSTAGEDDEQPAHAVTLDSFWIDRTEVTNVQYARCDADGPCWSPSSSYSQTRDSYYGDSQFNDYPVIWVSWHEADTYCGWVGGRLPSEAEWEYAARGPDDRVYPWGNVWPNDTLVNYNSNVGDTTQVGSYPGGSSWVSAMDMAGNVNEWVNDWYVNNYYSTSPQENPTGPDFGDGKVLRGGSYFSGPDLLRSARRFGSDPVYGNHVTGFRCVVASTPSP